jgi:uncharacterized protein (DUF4415 family)
MSEKPKNTELDWSKFDAHIITQDEYEEIPELTDEQIAQADLYNGTKLIQRGRPKSENNKVLLSVRYSREVVEYFKSTGEGWQTRMDEALKEWVKDHAA